MKRIFLGTLFFLVYAAAVSAPPIFKEGLKSPGSVTVGDSTAPNTKAVLDLKSVTKGVLFPRMTTAQRNAIASPPEGLVVYDTSINAIFQYDGSAWRQVASDGLSPNFSGLILGSGTGPLKATGGTVGTGDIDLSSEVTGTLAVSAGGTGTGTTGANLIFAGPTSGGNAAPSFRSLVADDIPGLDASKITSGTIGKAFGGTGIDNSSVTFPTAGTVATTTGTTFLNNLFTNPTANLLTLVSQDTPPTPPSVFSKYNLYVDEPTRKLVLQDATGNEVPIGSGGGGPKNLLKFPDFENGGTAGWLTGTLGISNGNPSGTPLFGFNATALIQGIGTGAAIEGSWSLWYIISSASVPGDFTSSIEIAIDENLRTKLLKFRFSYKIVSGASNGTFGGTNSDSFGVAAYDVTNSKWIPISEGQFCFTQVLGVGDCVGYFQVPYGAETIRFIPIYNANATSGAVSVYLDDFYLGPDDILTPQVSKPTAQGSKTSGAHTDSGNYQDVSFTEVEDSHGAFNGTTFTVPEPGDYIAFGVVGFDPNDTGIRAVRVVQAGSDSQSYIGATANGSSTVSAFLPFSAMLKAQANDTIKVQAFQTSGGSLNYSSDGSWFNIFKVSGEGGSGLASGPPEITILTSSSGTFNTPAGTKYLEIEMIGGGGGGGGSSGNNTGDGGNGGNGGNTTFGNLLVAVGGGGGGAGTASVHGSGGTTGSATVNSPAIQILAYPGTRGGPGELTAVSNASSSGGNGGMGPFGGFGAAGKGNGQAGYSATANSGAGGGGASGGQGASQLNYGGGGGASGAYIKAIIPTPDANYTYSVGAAGSPGTAGTNGAVGGTGAAGIIVVKAYKNSSGLGILERVHFDAYTTNATIGTSLADVVFGTEVEDSHGWYDHTTGVFTAGKPLLCDFGWSISTQAATLSTTERFVSILYLNSAIKRIGSRIIGNGASNTMTSVGPAMGLKLNAGDQVKIQAVSSQSVAGSTNVNEVSFSGNCVAH